MPERCLHELFEVQADRSPRAIALTDAAGSLTYAELDRAANRLARHLVSLGVTPESRVGVLLARDRSLVIAILAVLKAGGCYVPLDRTYPAAHVAFVAGDARLQALVCDEGPALEPVPVGARVVRLDREAGEIDRLPDGRPSPAGSSRNLAYVLYTSGSTGRPKGVAVEHRSAVALVEWAGRAFGPSRLASVLASTSICFDLSVFEIFAPLATGGGAVVVENALHLSPLAERAGVTLVNTVPSAMRQLVESGQLPPTAETVCLAGEPLPVALATAVYATGTVRALYNLYGPTEDTTYSTWSLVDPAGDGRPPIGWPIDGTEAHVLDEGLRPVPDGEPGEVYLAGSGLARGYLDRPAQTADRFIPSPWSRRPGARLYRTGDLARRRPDGQLEYLGRIDHQVKVRGHRVELGEVEARLGEHPGVGHAVVLARPGEAGPESLVAYVLPRPGDRPAASELRDHVAARLPGYMVPSACVLVEEMPLTPNGKVDRSALARLPLDDQGPAAEPPQGELERAVAAAWSDVLRVARPGRHDDFFGLGGHSLSASRVVSRLERELGARVPLARFFERPTVAGLAAALAAEQRRPRPAGAMPPPRPGSQPGGELSSIQQRLWVLEQLHPGAPALRILGAWRATGDLDAGALEAAIDLLVARHEALRTTFPSEAGRPRRVVRPHVRVALPVTDLSGLGPAARAREADRCLQEERQRPLDLANGPLLGGRLVRLGPGEHLLALTFHHLVADGWSVAQLLRELERAYPALRDGVPAALEPPAFQYGDYVDWQRRRLEGGELADQVRYWTDALAGAEPLDLPLDRPRPRSQSLAGASRTVRLPAELGVRVAELSRRLRATPAITMLAAFQLLLHRLTGQEDVVVGVPFAGRTHPAVESMAGVCINTLPIRARVAPGEGFEALVERTRRGMLDAHRNQDVPFERLLDDLRVERDPSRNPVFQVLFNVYNFGSWEASLPAAELAPLSNFVAGALFDLTLYVRDEGGRPALDLVYNTDLFDPATAGQLLEQYVELLDRVVAAPGEPAGRHSLVTASAGGLLPDPAGPIPDLGPAGESLHERLDRFARERPGWPAVVDEAGPVSYAELAGRSDAVAALLRDAGVGGGDVVAVAGSRSASLVVALLGVLRAGAAFTVLDPAYPAARLAEQVQQTRPRAWVDTGAGGVSDLLGRCPRVDARAPGAPAARPAAGWRTGPEEVAYVAFTSGSTGRPKSVLGRWGPVEHFVRWHVSNFGLHQSQRFGMLSGLAHDPLLRDVFTPLWLGACLHVPAQATLLEAPRLFEWLDRSQVNVVHVTPIVARILAGRGPLSHLSHVFLGGDLLGRDDAARLRDLMPNAALVNFYGTTETPQAMAWHELRPGEGPQRASVPLGRGIPGAQLLVVNAAGGLCGVGEVGEIQVRSPHLSIGYLGQEGATAERFRPNPFSGVAGDVVYRTGDLGRYLADGGVEFCGRADRQVKVRGFRVELAEVEAALRAHEAVRDLVVVADGDRSDERRLIAYVVPAAGRAFTLADLRQHARRSLPEPMVPGALHLIDELPLTPNGKVDEGALPRPQPAHPEAEPGFVAPQTDLESVVAGIWAQALKLSRVGLRNNFFDLGGSSLTMVEVHARLEQVLGRRLSLVDLFRYPDVHSLAAFLGHPEARDDAVLGLARRRVQARRQASFRQHGTVTARR